MFPEEEEVNCKFGSTACIVSFIVEMIEVGASNIVTNPPPLTVPTPIASEKEVKA